MAQTLLKFEEDIGQGTKDYIMPDLVKAMIGCNLNRATTNVVEMIKDAWENVGFETGELRFDYDGRALCGSSTGELTFKVIDEQMEPLDESDRQDLIGEIQESITGTMLRWLCKTDIQVGSADSLIVKVSVATDEYAVQRAYTKWFTFSVKGLKALGL